MASRLSDGNRIVILGDSLTQAGVHAGGFVRLFHDSISQGLPGCGVEVIGAGVSGNRVPDCQERLQAAALDLQPSDLVIYIGINDVWHSTRGEGTPLDVYREGLTDLVERSQRRGVRVWLCTPSVIGEKTDGTNSLDGMLDEYASVSREVALATGAELIDLRRLFLERLEQINPDNRPHSLLTTDGVHLNAMGNRFVAQCFVDAFEVPACQSPERLLRHIVLVRFQDDVSASEIEAIDEAFRRLATQIDMIHGFEGGRDNSPEGLQKGFTHVYVVTFLNENDRDIYLPHPLHQAFVRELKPLLEDVLVVDFWADVSGVEEA